MEEQVAHLRANRTLEGLWPPLLEAAASPDRKWPTVWGEDLHVGL